MRQMSRFPMLAAVAVVLVVAAGCARLDPGRGRANEAYAERLNGQAVAEQQEAARSERARAAWSARLTEQARAYGEQQAAADRAARAWSQRLTELAEHELAEHTSGSGGMSDRAVQAWTDRLNGLAGR